MHTASVHTTDQAAAYQVQAMDKVQREKEDLGSDCVIALIDLFRSDSSAVEVYMAIILPIILQKWLNKQMMLLGFPNYVPGEKDVPEVGWVGWVQFVLLGYGLDGKPPIVLVMFGLYCS